MQNRHNSLKFEFREEKLVQAIAFFSQVGVPDLTKLKLAKLLYFADKEHLNRFGRPITGDFYVCMQYGPVPSISLNEMNSALDSGAEVVGAEGPALRAVLDVDRSGHYPKFRLKAGAAVDREVFSRSDLAVLQDVAENHGNKLASVLVDESHLEAAWRKADRFRAPKSCSPIPFEYLFEESSSDMLEAALLSQKEDEELEAFLQSRSLQQEVELPA